MARTNTIGGDPAEVDYQRDLQEWMRTRSPFKRDALRTPRIRLTPDRLRYERWDVPIDPAQPVDLPHVDGIDSRYFRSTLGAGIKDRHPANGLGRAVGPGVQGRPGPGGDGSPREDAERQTNYARYVRDEMRKSPEDSVFAWIIDFGRQETVLQSLVNRGKFAEARDYYEQLRQIVDDNYDDIIEATTLGWMGPDGENLAAMAKRVANDEYLNTPVALVDGSASTLGALVRDGGQIMVDAARDEFDALGLPPETADLLFNGTGQQRALLKALTQPLLSNRGVVPDRMQRVDLIDQVVTRWDELEGVFGEGTAYLVQRLQDTHAGVGGAPAMLSTLASIAEVVKSGQGLEGRDLVREVFGSYTDLQSAMFQDAEGKARKIEDVPVAQRLMLDSALSSTLQELTRRNAGVDLRSPVFMRAMLEAMDLQAYGLSAGLDLVGTGRATARAMPQAVARYVADAMTLDPAAVDQGNPVYALRVLRDVLGQRVRGGLDFAETSWRMTGDPSDYMNSVARGLKGYSSSPGADGLADAFHKQMFRALAPKIVAGLDLESAMAEAQEEGLAQSIAEQVFQPYLAGAGAADAAQALASDTLARFTAGQAVNLQDSFMDLGFGNGSPLDDIVKESIRDWYNGNVLDAVRYAQPSQELVAHYMVDEGLPAQKASAMAARVRMTAAGAERIGQDPMKVYEEALAQGTVYTWDESKPQVQKDKDGNVYRVRYDPVTGAEDMQTGMPLVQKTVADRRNYGWTYGGDNVAFEASNAQLKAWYDQRQDALARHRQLADAITTKQDMTD